MPLILIFIVNRCLQRSTCTESAGLQFKDSSSLTFFPPSLQTFFPPLQMHLHFLLDMFTYCWNFTDVFSFSIQAFCLGGGSSAWPQVWDLGMIGIPVSFPALQNETDGCCTCTDCTAECISSESEGFSLSIKCYQHHFVLTVFVAFVTSCSRRLILSVKLEVLNCSRESLVHCLPKAFRLKMELLFGC